MKNKSDNYDKNERYSRQILFSGIGVKGQKKLTNSKLAVISCGRLGSVIIGNLTRAGIGYLRIVDKDRLDITNLQRQVLYDENDLNSNLYKAEIVANKIKSVNSEVEVDIFPDKVTGDNINEIISGMDIFLDGTDNLDTRFIINQACIKEKIPWIFGSVTASYGMVYNIIPGKTCCFNCIFSEVTPAQYLETSANVGILNTAVNVIASIQTTEALKYLTSNENLMIKNLLLIDLWDVSFDFVKVEVNHVKKCTVCGAFSSSTR